MRDDDYVCTRVLMDTPVTMQVPRAGAGVVAEAFGWFERIEASCSRFNPRSELMQLTSQAGVAVPVSAMLFEAVSFALALARESHGAFDPTVGHTLESRGFNREYSTGERVVTPIAEGAASYRDVVADPAARTITLLRPLVLDLGAVAKGLAIDMAAHELRPLEHFAIDAGGDLYLGGCRPDGTPWSVGIRHPRPHQAEQELIDTLFVTDAAVCTSGDYERRSPDGSGGHHIFDPRTGRPAGQLASVTVVAPTAMSADAVATAAFVLGPDEGLRLCERQGVDALMLSPGGDRYETRGMRSGQYRRSEAILRHAQGAADPRAGAARGGGGAARRP